MMNKPAVVKIVDVQSLSDLSQLFIFECIRGSSYT